MKPRQKATILAFDAGTGNGLPDYHRVTEKHKHQLTGTLCLCGENKRRVAFFYFRPEITYSVDNVW